MFSRVIQLLHASELLSFLLGNNVIKVCHTVICSLAEECLGCFHFGPIVNNTAMNIDGNFLYVFSCV